MRIITGDECGLLKETIPELSRPSSSSFEGDTKLTSPASDEGVSRIEINSRQSRSRGVVGLAFLPPSPDDNDNNNDNDGGDDDDGDDENDREEEEEKRFFNTNKRFNFAALRVDGSVESWEGQVSNVKKNTKNGGWQSRDAGQYRQRHLISSNVFADAEEGKTTSDDEELQKVQEEEEEKEKEKKKSELFTASRPITIVSPYTSSSSTSTASTAASILACCDSLGRISILNPNNNNNNDDDGIVARYNAFGKGNNEENAKISILKGNAPNSDIASACVIDSLGGRIAVGGRERETVLLDVETGKYLWKAKNLPPDPQTLLQQPIWSTSIQFLTSSSSSNDTQNSNLLAVGTAYKQVRLYDIRSSTTRRRPVAYTAEDGGGVLTHRITALCQTAEYQLVVGDSAGYMHSIDVRYMLNNPNPKISSKKQSGSDRRGFLGRYNGPAGSIRQIVKHDSLNIMSCVGLDRMLRTYDINSRKMLDCVYLKQRLNCVMFCEDGLVPSLAESKKERDMVVGEGVVGEDGIARYEDGKDIDQDDDVQDYVDSDDEDVADQNDGQEDEEDEDETEEDSAADDKEEEEEDGDEDNGSEGGEESVSDEDDASDPSDDGDSSDDDSEEEEEEEEDHAPSKSGSRKGGKAQLKPKKRMRHS